MNRHSPAMLAAVVALAAAGCNWMAPGKFVAAPVSYSLFMPTAAESPAKYVAERDELEIITAESRLQKSAEAALSFCATIHCELVSSSIIVRTESALPSGRISLRVAPDDLQKLLSYIEGLGKVAQHTTERTDETTDVVDTDAKIKNLTGFRDNLRKMLARPSASVGDLVEIQKQLTDTQSELDSETAQRKMLANETEKIAVQVSFRVEEPSTNGGGLAQVWQALRESGFLLGDSVAALIATIVYVIPWLILIVPIIWLFRKGWRKFGLGRNRSAHQSSGKAS